MVSIHSSRLITRPTLYPDGVETSAGNTERNIVLQRKERGCKPNLRGASPVGRDEGGRSYATHTVSRGRPK